MAGKLVSMALEFRVLANNISIRLHFQIKLEYAAGLNIMVEY